jgi:proteasome lid subunit RPN8/RPN11
MLKISKVLTARIEAHMEKAYPGEGAGFLLGLDGDVKDVLPLDNAREEEARYNRFLLTPEDYMKAEMKAMEQGMDLIGVFHSHPDCPNVPSEYDREWAQPFFSYIITRVDNGRTVSHRSWRLLEDRTKYEEEKIEISGEENVRS